MESNPGYLFLRELILHHTRNLFLFSKLLNLLTKLSIVFPQNPFHFYRISSGITSLILKWIVCVFFFSGSVRLEIFQLVFSKNQLMVYAFSLLCLRFQISLICIPIFIISFLQLILSLIVLFSRFLMWKMS